jgi:ESF2/ABP1 family protein
MTQNKKIQPVRDATAGEPPRAGPSRLFTFPPVVEKLSPREAEPNSEHGVCDNEDREEEGEAKDSEHEGSPDGFVDGMDPEGFVGEKTLKPLTPEALAVFKEAQNRAGVIYISRIPPGMRPTKVRHLMSAFGAVGRVYLQQEGTSLGLIQERPN